MPLFNHTCGTCGSSFTSKKINSKYCCRPCLWEQNGKHQQKKDCWWINSSGCIEGRVILEDGSVKRVKQHRHIYECFHSVKLSHDDGIHHINGVKTDNRIENLERIPHGKHTEYHNNRREYNKGYKLNLTDEERFLRSERIKKTRAWEYGLPKAREALAKARGGK